MNIWKKAASLIVEMPPDEPPPLDLHSSDISTDDIPMPPEARLSYEMDEGKGNEGTWYRRR